MFHYKSFQWSYVSEVDGLPEQDHKHITAKEVTSMSIIWR